MTIVLQNVKILYITIEVQDNRKNLLLLDKGFQKKVVGNPFVSWSCCV